MNQHEPDPRQEWATPQEFFDVVDAEFHFDLDAAATTENAKCKLHIDPESDALSKKLRWCDEKAGIRSVWLNPGFSNVEPWLKRAYHEAQKFEDAEVVVMTLVSPSAHWWRDWAMQASEIRLIGGKRVQFEPAEGVKKSSNARENCLIIFRNEYQEAKRLDEGPWIHTWDWTAIADGAMVA